MEAGVVDRIVSLRDDGYVKDVGGVTYSVRDLKPVYFEPRPDSVKLLTLTGLAEFIKLNLDGLDSAELLLHVKDPKTVRLLRKISGVDKKRDEYARAVVDENLAEYPFGQYMGTEEFAIRLRSMFQGSEDLEALIAYASKITTGTTIELGDDGITQNATVKRSASGALKDQSPAPVISRLRPFRTFRELEQPQSDFLFRIHSQEERAPVVALFEADGGRWRNQAVQDIQGWLKEKLPDIAIIA